jgi:phage repressor protein C with HTH and peptisase S24 domain
MLSHDRVWAAIDALASRYGMTASGLARKAGLDATSFNKSKRTSPEGRDRWPSTESVSKILQATGATLEDFLRLVDPAASTGQSSLPLITSDKAGAESILDEEGRPTGGPEWDSVEFPGFEQGTAFALEVRKRGLDPHYRDGDVLIVSANAPLKKGDRVIVSTKAGDLLAREFSRRSARSLELASANQGDEDQVIALEDVAWVARVLWVRQ